MGFAIGSLLADSLVSLFRALDMAPYLPVFFIIAAAAALAMVPPWLHLRRARSA